MLILTRRPGQAISFPDVGIAVRVLGRHGNGIRLGVDAPASIRVLRDELAAAGAQLTSTGNLSSITDEPVPASDGRDIPSARSMASTTAEDDAKAIHSLRNRLNKVALRMDYYEQLLASGKQAEAASELARIREILTFEFPQPCDPWLDQSTEETRRRRILVVEDDEEEREMLSAILRMRGYQVCAVADGVAAWNFFESDSCDVMLVDMLMPRSDGPTLVRRIRGSRGGYNLPILAVSARNPLDLGLSVGGGGADAWIPKPVRLDALCGIIEDRLACAN